MQLFRNNEIPFILPSSLNAVATLSMKIDTRSNTLSQVSAYPIVLVFYIKQDQGQCPKNGTDILGTFP